MRHVWLIGTMLALGAGHASASAPAWCKGAGKEKIDFDITNGNGDFKYKTDADDLADDDALTNIVGALCTPGPESDTDGAEAKKYHAELEAARTRWSKRLGMIDDDWVDAAAWAASDVGSRRGLDSYIKIDLDKRPWSSLSPVEQYAGITRGSGISGTAMLDYTYFADALGPKISLAARLGYIKHCLDSNATPVDWALCQPDIDAFDMNALSAELRADKAGDGFTKMTIRLVADGYARSRFPAHAADVKKLIAKDPAYAKLFELSANARKDWNQRWAADAALVALASAMDDANATHSRRALEGCDEKAWKAWQAAVAKVPAKTFAGMHDDLDNGDLMYDAAMTALLTNPEVYLAGEAYALCHAGDAKKDFFTKLLGDTLARWPGHRGPRNSAIVAIMKAGIELDDRDAKLDYPDVYRQWFPNGSGTHGGGAFGAVSKVKASGKSTHLEFAAVPVKVEQCSKEVVTHRIERIRDDGTLVYERRCLSSKMVTVNRASTPTDVDARFAAGLKPGMVVSVIEGVMIAAWPSNGAKQPSIVFGVGVK